MSTPLRTLVTGATGGIGRATAERLLADGGQVFLTDHTEDVVALASTLGCAGAAVADASDRDAVRASTEAAVEAMGGLDCLFLNAGTEGVVAPLASQDPGTFLSVFQVNVMGVVHGLQAGLAHLLESGRGRVVMTASVASFIGSPGLAPYCTSKHALLGLMRSAAMELGPQGVRVNSVHPGPIDNRMMESIEHMAAPGNEQAVRAGFSARIPLGRYGRNEEIAAAVAFLLSDDAAYCHGQTLVVDGGMRAG